MQKIEGKREKRRRVEELGKEEKSPMFMAIGSMLLSVAAQRTLTVVLISHHPLPLKDQFPKNCKSENMIGGFN